MLYILLILLLLLACALLMRSLSSCKRQALALSQTASKLTKTEEALSSTKAELEAASGKIQALERDLAAAQCDQRDLFFARLLCGGHFQSPDALLADGEAVKVSFPGRCFLVLAAKLETWGEMFESGEMDRKDAYFILRNTQMCIRDRSLISYI